MKRSAQRLASLDDVVCDHSHNIMKFSTALRAPLHCPLRPECSEGCTSGSSTRSMRIKPGQVHSHLKKHMLWQALSWICDCASLPRQPVHSAVRPVQDVSGP
jgi:hypothetical protein